MEKLNEHIVYDLFLSKGYAPLEKYINSLTPLKCEKQGYWYKISYSNLRSGKKPSLWGINNICFLEHNFTNFLVSSKSKAQLIDYQVIKKGKHQRILMTIKCECGKIFKKTLEDCVYKTYVCCPECTLEKRGNTRRKGKFYIQFIESQGYKVVNKKINYRTNDWIEVIDSKGFKGFVTYSHIKSGRKMSRFDVRANQKHYIYNVNRWAELQNVGCRCLDFAQTQHTRQGLLFQCECGNYFTTSISSFQNGKVVCDECAKSISRYERIFKEYLNQNNIEYIWQYSLNECRDILPLPFDFYLSLYKVIIEIDGEGHFFPCHFNQISDEKAQITFDITKYHDNIKNKYCETHEIPLLRIPYYTVQDGSYQQLFQNFIKEVTGLN